jgi:hypothetical protein
MMPPSAAAVVGAHRHRVPPLTPVVDYLLTVMRPTPGVAYVSTGRSTTTCADNRAQERWLRWRQE